MSPRTELGTKRPVVKRFRESEPVLAANRISEWQSAIKFYVSCDRRDSFRAFINLEGNKKVLSQTLYLQTS